MVVRLAWEVIIRLRRIACFLTDRDRVEARMGQVTIDYTNSSACDSYHIARDVDTFRHFSGHAGGSSEEKRKKM